MKNVAIICAALLVVGMVASASAAEGVSKSTLASMGFASAQSMSDLDGMAVRGKGFTGSTSAEVSGKFSAAFYDLNNGIAKTTNGYEAESSHAGENRSSAQGTGLSKSGITFLVLGKDGDIVSGMSTMIMSVGGASASAK